MSLLSLDKNFLVNYQIDAIATIALILIE